MFHDNASLDALPYDIKQLILLQLDHEKDLLHLGLSNKGWKDLVIPYHLEYRTLSLNRNRPEVWRHLAEKRHLASRIRRVVIGPGFMMPGDLEREKSYGEYGGWAGRRGCDRDVYPRARERSPLPTTYRYEEVRRAFANMRSLDVFRWEGRDGTYDDNLEPGEYRTHTPSLLPRFVMKALEGLLEAKSVQRLRLRDYQSAVFGPQNKAIGNNQFPLWNFSGLESLSLNIHHTLANATQQPTLANLLKLNLNTLAALELNLRYVPAEAMSWTFPNLKTLSLTCDIIGPVTQLVSYPQNAHILLAANPTIRDLDLRVPISLAFKPLPGRFLPNLKTLRLAQAGVPAFGLLMNLRSVDKPLESLSGLALTEETMVVMRAHREALAGLKFLSIDSVNHPAMLARLGMIIPNLEALQSRMRCCSPIVLDFDDFMALVSDMPALRTVDGIAVRTMPKQKESLVDHVSSATSSLEFVAVASCSAFFKVNLAKDTWEEIDNLGDLFLHDKVDAISQYLPACPW